MPYTDPAKWAIDVPGLAQEGMSAGILMAPTINASQMQQLSQMMDQAMPGWRQNLAQMQKTNASLMAGQVPQDVQDQITRSSAYQALQSGMGGGGAGTAMAGKTITARDLGLTSLDLQKTGQSQSLQQMSFQRNYTMPQPVNPMSLVPLSDLLSSTEWSKTAAYNASVQSFIAKSNAAAAGVGAPQQSVLGGVGGDLAGLVTALGKQNPNTGQTGFGALSSMFGGLFGGGGGTADSLNASEVAAGGVAGDTSMLGSAGTAFMA